ncbi:MAG: hypothetical protein ACN4GF_09355 [Lentimonas sp.]
MLKDLEAGVSWTGRVVPLANQHDSSSVEVMVCSNTENAGRICLYTIEHPYVNGQLRLSSRSEFTSPPWVGSDWKRTRSNGKPRRNRV